MRVVLGNYAPSLSSSRSRSGADIVCAKQAVGVHMLAKRARWQALVATRIDSRTKPAMSRGIALQ